MEHDIKDTVLEFFAAMMLPLKSVDVELREDNEYYINVVGQESSILIGHHGKNLGALQHLIRIILQRKFDESIQIMLDVDGYRKRQEEGVIAIAERKVDALRMSKQAQSLPPMSPYFRRVVHLYLRKPEFSDVATQSDGEGEMRRVVLSLTA